MCVSDEPESIRRYVGKCTTECPGVRVLRVCDLHAGLGHHRHVRDIQGGVSQTQTSY